MNWKEFERIRSGLIEELSPHLPGGIEENHENSQSTQLVPRVQFDGVTATSSVGFTKRCINVRFILLNQLNKTYVIASVV
jgi:hypothetical protein